ncbi:MAG: hypothetical protein FJ088_04120, partial [Deltaproteobacteria bacterium]|nr:hypothetical protein [Deltaproteobacteria bacterium]
MKESSEFLEKLEDSLVFVSGGAFLAALLISLTEDGFALQTALCAISIAAGGSGILKGALG